MVGRKSVRTPDEEGRRQVRPRSCLPLAVGPSQKKHGLGSDEERVSVMLNWVSSGLLLSFAEWSLRSSLLPGFYHVIYCHVVAMLYYYHTVAVLV